MSEASWITQEIRREVAAAEARVLLRVAEAFRAAYTPGYYGMGGPQDGDDVPPSFSGTRAAKLLEDAAEKAAKS